MVKVGILMSDYGHDPSETAIPYAGFKSAGFDIDFITEKGTSPKCDAKMLEGITQKILGAKQYVITEYNKMILSEEWKSPSSWSTPGFSLDQYDLVFVPGGHEKSVRQVIDSETVHKLMADYFPKTKKPATKAVGAVCHGVMVLSSTKLEDGKSVLHGVKTTALPARFEQLAFWGTRAFLGDYYKTYGACSENVEESVTKVLEKPSDFKNSLGMGPFVVEDETYNYVSARFPGDVDLLAEKLVNLARSITA
ncbi:hypothetical protein Golomagni_07079 [Golovinomyces magnicellulatus]|nr:hypothetical protein Golomagni_07079 [Golovinomyces magnicellulatus]